MTATAPRTVNGKTKEELIKELTADFPDSDYDIALDGSKYLPIEKYEERFNDVVGYLNYDKLVAEPQIIQFNDKMRISVNVSITIKDDNGEAFVTKSANGGTSVIVVKETGNDKSLKSDVASAATDGFKQVMKSFGVGIGQLRTLNAKKKKSENGKGNTQKSPEAIAKSFIITGSYQKLAKSYKVSAKDKETGEPVVLVLWKDAFNLGIAPSMGARNEAEAAEQFFARYGCGKVLPLKGYYNDYNGERQFVYKTSKAA